MELVKEKWTKKDGEEFNKHLYSLRNEEKMEWTKNIINTNMKVLAIKSPVIKDIAKQIAKGNYESFLDLMLWEYYENTAVNGFLISKIKDFEILKKYLIIYSKKADNWGTCDTIAVNVKGKEKEFFDLAEEFIKSQKPFVRRIGIDILFNFVSNLDYIDKIFKILNSFTNEEEYYVNMVNAWLICECFIKQKDKTLEFLKTNKLNVFTVNKGVQKCRDSFRVSKEDKEMLLKFKR